MTYGSMNLEWTEFNLENTNVHEMYVDEIFMYVRKFKSEIIKKCQRIHLLLFA